MNLYLYLNLLLILSGPKEFIDVFYSLQNWRVRWLQL
jgi:hypothetical protein